MRSSNDPITGLKNNILEWGVVEESELKAIDKEARHEVEVAVEEAKKSPEPRQDVDMWTDIYYKGTAPMYMRGREREEVSFVSFGIARSCALRVGRLTSSCVHRRSTTSSLRSRTFSPEDPSSSALLNRRRSFPIRFSARARAGVDGGVCLSVRIEVPFFTRLGGLARVRDLSGRWEPKLGASGLGGCIASRDRRNV